MSLRVCYKDAVAQKAALEARAGELEKALGEQKIEQFQSTTLVVRQARLDQRNRAA